MIAAITFLREHWRGLGAAAGLVCAFALGYHAHARLHPPTACAPAIAAKVDDHAAKVVDATKDTTTQTGPRKVVTYNFDPVVNFPEKPITPADLCRPIVVPGLSAPVAVPAGERLESVTVEEDGASRTETRAATQTHATEDRHLSLTVTPAAARAPWLELQLGLEDVLNARTARAAARVRVTDSGWLELSARPGEWMAGHKDFGVAFAKAF